MTETYRETSSDARSEVLEGKVESGGGREEENYWEGEQKPSCGVGKRRFHSECGVEPTNIRKCSICLWVVSIYLDAL